MMMNKSLIIIQLFNLLEYFFRFGFGFESFYPNLEYSDSDSKIFWLRIRFGFGFEKFWITNKIRDSDSFKKKIRYNTVRDHTHIMIFSSLVLLSDFKLLFCESRLISLFFHLWQHSLIINYSTVRPDSHCNNMPSESTFTLDKFTLYYFITSWFIAFLPTLRQAFFVLLTLVQRPASHWINWTPETSLGEPYFDRGDQTQRETVTWIFNAQKNIFIKIFLFPT